MFIISFSYVVFYYISIKMPITAAFGDSFISLIIYLSGYIILLSAEGIKRKNAVGVYYLILFIYIVFGVVGNTALGTYSYYLEIIQALSRILIAFLSIMLFLNIRLKVGRLPASKNGMLVAFIFSIALEAVYYFIKYQDSFAESMFSVVVLLPVILLAYIACRSFDDIFYNHFIEENRNISLLLQNRWIGIKEG